MKNIKLSFALIVAIVAVGITVASQAGTRAVTRCFINLEAARLDGTSIIIHDDATQLTCLEATNLIFNPTVPANSYKYVKFADPSAATSFASEATCPPDNELYCCVKVVQDPLSPYQVDLGEGLNRYSISQVFCKPE